MLSAQSDLRILVVSSRGDFLKGILGALTRDFNIQYSQQAESASFLIKEWEPQVCLIDGEKNIDCIQSLYPLIHKDQAFSILVYLPASHRGKELECVKLGADDVLHEGINPEFLKIRIQSCVHKLRKITGIKQPARESKEGPAIIQLGMIHIHKENFLVKREDRLISLTPTQFRLLVTFATTQDKLLSRSWLKENVWNNAEISLRSIDAQISKLKKLVPELDPYLVNVYGKGYVFSYPRDQAA